MLIRFFKEIDLIGCGGDTQPIRIMVGTLSQSDNSTGVVGTLSQSDYTGLVHAGVVHAGVVHAGVGCTGVACAGVVGTLSQSDYTGVACKGCTRKGGGATQPIRLHRGCA